jgi:hypothetical protein
MNNYGAAVLNKENKLIGYKINNIEHASIITYYNSDNLLCNKVFIRDFDREKLAFINEPINSWIDTKTEFGFTREFKDKKYYYDKNNIIFNVEVNYSGSKFPSYKKDTKLDDKIGTLDFETYGSNLGTGYHQVYAAGFSIKNHTQLDYITLGETSENFVNRFFKNIFIH